MNRQFIEQEIQVKTITAAKKKIKNRKNYHSATSDKVIQTRIVNGY